MALQSVFVTCCLRQVTPAIYLTNTWQGVFTIILIGPLSPGSPGHINLTVLLLWKHCQRFLSQGDFQKDYFLKDGLAKYDISAGRLFVMLTFIS